MSSPDEAQRERLFFALWPDDAVRLRLLRAAREAGLRGGRALRPDNLHLTLSFLGGVDAAQRACFEALAGEVAVEPFPLQLDRAGWFARPRVAWIGARAVPPALLALATALERGRSRCRQQPETRPFRAHVTVQRKAGGPPAREAVTPVVWAVHEFALVRSRSGPHGAQYTPLRRWSLRGTG